MPGAARVGDTTAHGGTVVGPGVATVLIAGMPAAVVGDMHACVIPPPSHVPASPFVAGSATVLVQGRAAPGAGGARGGGAARRVGRPPGGIG